MIRAWRRSVQYITAHWKGQHSLARAVVCNLLGVSAVITVVLSVGSNRGPTDPLDPRPRIAASLLILALMCLVMVWQIVGTTRSVLIRRKSTDRVLRVLIGSLLVLWSSFLVIGAVTLGTATSKVISVATDDETLQPFHIALVGSSIFFYGGISFDAADQVKRVLESSKGVSRIQIASNGGRIGAAVMMASILQRARVNRVRVIGTCGSACTILLAQMPVRERDEQADIWSHSPSGDGAPGSSVVQGIARQRYREGGVSEWLIDEFLDTPPQSSRSISILEGFRSNLIDAVISDGGYPLNYRQWRERSARQMLRASTEGHLLSQEQIERLASQSIDTLGVDASNAELESWLRAGATFLNGSH